MLIGTLAGVRKRRRGAPQLGYYAPDLGGGVDLTFAFTFNGEPFTFGGVPFTYGAAS